MTDIKKEEIEEAVADPDPDWIKGEFESELFLSTDGKHTVRVKANDTQGRKAGLKWAKKVYEAIIERYGTKQAQAVKEYKNNGKTIPTCPECGAEMKERTSSKTGKKFWGCSNYPDCKGVVWND